MLSVGEIQAKYSHPMSYTMALDKYCTSDLHYYSVDGAFCMYVGYLENFPTVQEVISTLLRVNPSLGIKYAEEYALEITAANDVGLFDQAWTLLDAALNTPTQLDLFGTEVH